MAELAEHAPHALFPDFTAIEPVLAAILGDGRPAAEWSEV
jgi:hypothetical protein